MVPEAKEESAELTGEENWEEDRMDVSDVEEENTGDVPGEPGVGVKISDESPYTINVYTTGPQDIRTVETPEEAVENPQEQQQEVQQEPEEEKKTTDAPMEEAKSDWGAPKHEGDMVLRFVVTNKRKGAIKVHLRVVAPEGTNIKGPVGKVTAVVAEGTQKAILHCHKNFPEREFGEFSVEWEVKEYDPYKKVLAEKGKLSMF